MASERSTESKDINETLQSPTLRSSNLRKLSPSTISPPLIPSQPQKIKQNKIGMKRLCATPE